MATLTIASDVARQRAVEMTKRLHQAEVSLEEAMAARVPIGDDAPEPDIEGELRELLQGVAQVDEPASGAEPELVRGTLSST